MSKYQEKKAKATNIILAGIGGGVLFFLVGLIANSEKLAILGIIGGGGVGVVGQRTFVEQYKQREIHRKTVANLENQYEQHLFTQENNRTKLIRMLTVYIEKKNLIPAITSIDDTSKKRAVVIDTNNQPVSVKELITEQWGKYKRV